MSMDPRRLYQEIVENEKQLRELLRANPQNVQDANMYRSRLIEKARFLADINPILAASREIEQVLWKPCFYRRIEEFRRRMRKYAAQAASDRAIREVFSRISQEFQTFLTEASAFYDQLREDYTQWLLNNRVSRIASQSQANVNATASPVLGDAAAINIEKCRHSLHRCLIFLGDLARYRELHSQRAKKNFMAAERCYLKALRVLPENGNPHNQLAVLATYSDAETVAVYRYCRSLLIAHPFTTAEENLALLFERSRQRPLLPPTMGIVTGSSPAKEKAAFLKSVLHRLTRLHGVLFSLATPPKRTASPMQAPPPTPAYSKEMESLVVKDFSALLRAGVMGDALLLKLVVTQIFCLLRSMGKTVAMDALRLTLRMMSQVLEFVVVELSRVDAQRIPSSLRLLGPVSTFCDFLRLNTNVIDHIEASMSNAQRADGNQADRRVVLEFLDNLVTLLNHSKIKALALASGPAERRLKEQQLQLKENIELRGFQPLQALFEHAGAFQWRDDLVTHSSTASPSLQPSSGFTEQDAWRVRAWNASRFGHFLCEEYEGNPLLYVFHGEFATTPAVTSTMNNGFQQKSSMVSNLTSTSLGPNMFSNSRTSTGNGNSNANANANANAGPADDEFDDEVIVYQPSPPPTSSMSVLTTRRSTSDGAATSQFSSGADSASVFGFSGSSPFDSALAFGASSSVFGSSMTQEDTSVDNAQVFRASFGEQRSSLRTSSSASSLDLPEYASFGGLNPFSTSSMWSNSTSSSSVTPLAGSFAANNQDDKNTRGMHDLDAVERESARYQQRTSTLSAFLGPLTMSPTSIAAPTVASPPMNARRASIPRPPPGFGDVNARRTPSPSAPQAPALEPQRQFFTRNPFVTP